MEQADLFKDNPAGNTLTPTDKTVTNPDEIRRLTGQSFRIVERLRKGPATNDELIQIARKFCARITDLRKKGYVILAYRKEFKTGLCYYYMFQEPGQSARFYCDHSRRNVAISWCQLSCARRCEQIKYLMMKFREQTGKEPPVGERQFPAENTGAA